MRKFSSYGPPNTKIHYYAPRSELMANLVSQLKGENPDEGGHYITVFAPRQSGKTWIMQEVLLKLQQEKEFDVVYLPLQHFYAINDINRMVQLLARKLCKELNFKKTLSINTLEDFEDFFEQENLSKPLILILDEFDNLSESVIAGLVSVFRNIYHSRRSQADKATTEKNHLLHSLALIGVRTVLGVENLKGSPFNIQRSVHIPNLTDDEVLYLFDCYQQESGQVIEPEVVERIAYEFQGQPGLTCWFGELLTETYNKTIDKPITMAHFETVYSAALDLLPNSNILNIVSKAKQEPYKSFVLQLFKTGKKFQFTYHDPIQNFLYLNGVVDVEEVSLNEHYVKFPSAYVQKQLFNYFSRELFQDIDHLYDPFEDLSDTITENSLNLRRLLQRYEQYLQANRDQVLKNAPRRQKDLRVYEAVFHFHFYAYLTTFLESYEAQVHPEFPTGNGTIDLLIRHANQLFGLELKSFANQREYQKALSQAAQYGKQLGLTDIALVLFIEAVDEMNQKKFEADYIDSQTGVIVHPQFVQTGKTD